MEIYPEGHPLDYGDSFRTLLLNASECPTSAHLLYRLHSILSTAFRPDTQTGPSPFAEAISSRPLPASAWAPLARALERWHAVANGSLDPSVIQFANSSEQPPALRSPAALGPSDLRPAPARPHRFTAALVVQTHKRVHFMRHLLDSLAQVSHSILRVFTQNSFLK